MFARRLLWLSQLLLRLPTLPTQCAICHAWPCTDIVCTDCWQNAQRPTFRCTGCALAINGLDAAHPRCGACLITPPIWQTAHAWTDYSYPWDRLITHWKFAQQPALAQHFARWMLQDPQVNALLQDADWVLAIPLSDTRMRERGYNQAAQLAQHLAPNKHLKHTLIRTQHHLPQSALTRSQRLRNLKNAFAVRDDHHLLKDKKVLLIDDVLTTGATLTAASNALLQASASQVNVLCLARTP